ncbi:hypothetical protein GTR00_21685, partial [Kineococcus sp. T90]
AGTRPSAHGGGRGSPEDLRRVLEDVGVDRLDHGADVVRDARLLALVRERGTAVTCRALPGAPAGGAAPSVVAALLRGGVRVAVVSGARPAADLVALAREADLDPDELVLLQRNAFEAAWVDDDEREGLLAELEAYAALVAPDL